MAKCLYIWSRTVPRDVKSSLTLHLHTSTHLTYASQAFRSTCITYCQLVWIQHDGACPVLFKLPLAIFCLVDDDAIWWKYTSMQTFLSFNIFFLSEITSANIQNVLLPALLKGTSSSQPVVKQCKELMISKGSLVLSCGCSYSDWRTTISVFEVALQSLSLLGITHCPDSATVAPGELSENHRLSWPITHWHSLRFFCSRGSSDVHGLLTVFLHKCALFYGRARCAL